MKRIHLAKFLAVPLIGMALITHHTFSEESFLDVASEGAGYTLLVAAALGRLWAAAFISGRKNAVLVMEGPYSIVRNPLYFFSFLGFVGAGLAFESLTLAIAFGLVFFLTHWPVIVREEKNLSQSFGETFHGYAATVPRFVPRPWKFQRPPPTVTISPAIFSRALVESLMVLGVFVAAELVEHIHMEYPSTVLFLIP